MKIVDIHAQMDVPQKECNKSLTEKSICTQEQLYCVEICNRPS